MTQDAAVVARAWLDSLASRSVFVTLRKGRISYRPASAYRLLTDGELQTLREHRDAIKAAVESGYSPRVAVGEGQPAALNDATEAVQGRCQYCGAARCVGREHWNFERIHRVNPIVAAEIDKREDECRVREDKEEIRQLLHSVWRTF